MFKLSPLEIKEVGYIEEIKPGILKISGLEQCMVGEVFEVENGTKGIIIGFDEKEVLGLLLGDESSVNLKEKVFLRKSVFKVGAGESFLGRVINSLGEPIDGKSKIDFKEFLPIFREAPGVLDRVPITRMLHTGIKIIDTCIPVGKGQRMLIIGDRVTGKTSLALDIIINQKDKDVICIYCWIGGSRMGLERVISVLKTYKAFEYSIIVAAPAITSAGEQFLAPYVGCAIGEYFMYKGKDVLVVFDDLTKHAWVWREHSLLLKRAPGREAYPGDIFYIHSQLMERAANLSPENGGGSMTFFPIVETQQGDVTGYIPSNLISMTDGQIYLNTTLFNEGFLPAVDLTLSVSRIGSKVQNEAMKEMSAKLRLEYSQYTELLQLTKLKTRVSPELAEKMKRGQTLRELFVQKIHLLCDLEEEIILFYAFSRNILEILPLDALTRFISGICPFVKHTRPHIIEELKTLGILTNRIKQALDESFVEFFKQEKIY